MNIVKFAKGVMWHLKNGTRYSVEDLQEALDHLAECNGGYHSCRRAVLIKDQVTNEIQELTVSNGQLQLNGVNV
jgi:hypothetical protein